MERGWVILIGVVISFVALAVIFWIFEKVVQKWMRERNAVRQRRIVPEDLPAHKYEPYRRYQIRETINLGQRRNPQVRNLLNDPYLSDQHEVIAIVAQDKARGIVAGMSALLNDGVIHWFVERVEGQLDACTALLCAVENWCSSWQGADPVFLLCEDKKVVKDCNLGRLHPHQTLTDFQLENNFSLNFQWSENFFCRDPDFQDLVESFSPQVKKLLNLEPENTADLPAQFWSGFLLSHWDLKQTRVSFEPKEVPTVEDLVTLKEVS